MYTSVQGPRTLFELVKETTKRHSPLKESPLYLELRMCIMVCTLIQDWEDYGIDWAGPVPHGCPNENTVTWMKLLKCSQCSKRHVSIGNC